MGVLTDSVTDLIVLSIEIVIVISMVTVIFGYLHSLATGSKFP